jgi:hypothetical protein
MSNRSDELFVVGLLLNNVEKQSDYEDRRMVLFIAHGKLKLSWNRDNLIKEGLVVY